MRTKRLLLGILLTFSILPGVAHGQSASPAIGSIPSPEPGAEPSEPPSRARSPGTAAASLITGSGDVLCPWGDELPTGADVATGEDNTSNAREFVFGSAPAELDAANRLTASWSAFTSGPMGAVSPDCTVYLFDDVEIDDIWTWYADTFPERSAPAPTEEPVPAGAPGEDGRLFHYAPSFERESWTYIFRSANVIAAVSLDAEVDAAVTVEELLPIADAVAARIEAAAAGEPMPPAPAPTPEPSFPTQEEAALLERVPAGFVDSCSRSEFGSTDVARAIVTCSVEVGAGSVTVTYQQLPDEAAMGEVYENTLSFMGVDADSGPCGSDWPSEGGYTIGGEPAGRVACALLGDVAAIISWTDDRLLIHGYAEGFGVGREALYDWWLQESGPVAPAPNGASPEASPIG